MAKVAITESYLEDIADAIRTKTGLSTARYYPSQMAPAILTISGSGGITPTGTIAINSNGTHNVTQYASANVNVPNSYSVSDEGKVVSSGALVSQTSETYTSNNTYDTTTISSVTVNVPQGSTINNQNKTVNPSTSQQSVSYDSGYTGLGTVTINAMPSGTEGTPTASKGTVSDHSISIVPSVTNTAGYIAGGTKTGSAVTVSADELVSGTLSITTNGTKNVTNYASVSVNVASGGTVNNQDKSVDPTESEQSITADDGYSGLGTVTVGAVSSTYVGSGITRRTSSSLSASGATVTAPAGYYETAATKSVTTMSLPTSTSASATSGYTSKATISRSTSDQYINIAPGYNSAGGYYKINAVADGTAGTPTASKGTVSSNSVTVTPSVTNTTGYITGGTKTGTGVTVSASELVSGNKAITSNGTDIDVTNYATVSVNVEGGGGGGEPVSEMLVATSTKTLTAASSSITFTDLLGEPSSFTITSAADQTTGGTKVAAVVYDGTSVFGMDITTQAEADTGFTHSYSNGTLTVTATTASFQANEYKLAYTYDGQSSNIGTLDVQVGSGATSITFSGVPASPDYFSCIFKSSFGTSSGYQRVIVVVYDGTSVYGMEMDSSGKYATHWTYSYTSGSLIISSNGTNQGGYFHQPGYYQLTYGTNGGGTITINNQNKTVTPTTSQQTVTYDTGYTGLGVVTVNAIPTGTAGTPTATKGSVSNHSISVTPSVTNTTGYITGSTKTGTAVSVSASELVSGNKSITSNGTNIDVTNYATVSVSVDTGGGSPTIDSLTVTPSETEQTFDSSSVDGYKPVTVEAISSTYVGSGITQRSSTDLSASGATVTVPAGYYASAASKAVASGSATGPSSLSGTSASVSTGTNTLTLTKTGVSTTPTVSAGYVSSATSSTATVTLTASVTTKAAATITPGTTDQTIASGTYLTGAQTISGDANLVAGNIKKDVTIFGTTGTYEGSGGGSSSMMVATTTKTLTSASSSIQFTGLSGQPTSFAIRSSAEQTTGGTKVVGVVYDGTSCLGIDLTTQAENDTGFTQSYSNGTLTVTATTASFQANEYSLVYTYGGSSANIGTADVQVGSGATSITFTDLEDEPEYFSCIFKSTFSTSSGYQRVMDVVYDGTSTYGNALDSSAKALTSWSYTYNNGSLTISSTGTNNGGYFHQPGYYQLTYAIDTGDDGTLQTKTVTPTTSVQNITADTAQGYTALKKVVVNAIPSSYVEPTTTVGATTYRASTSSQTINAGTYHSAAATIAAVTQTNLSAGNIKSGTTITISNGQSNLWSVTGTYEGSGGGDSKNVQTAQSTTRRANTALGSINSLTCSTTGTYDVYWTCARTNTSNTWGSQLYIGGTAYGTENTTWSNNVQNNHLTGVSISANQTVAVYGRSRGSNYYIYAPQLTIVQTS